MDKGFYIPGRKLGEARKKIKFDPQARQGREVSEFDTRLDEDDQKKPVVQCAKSTEPEYSIGIEQEKKRNRDMLAGLLEVVKPSSIVPEKVQPQNNKGTQSQQQSGKASTSPFKPKKQQPVSENWKKFLAQSSQTSTKKSYRAPPVQSKSPNTDYVALDCQFVQCEDGEQVARISIVNQRLEELFESYIRPLSKIVDYRTEVSGITYGHIKRAPTWDAVKYEIEKILIRKNVVGHTLWKDLEVMGMSKWNGFASLIDINKYSQYQQNGKLQSLKRLAQVFLQKEIQTGIHSSLQDAKATMSLFLLRKEKILSEIDRTKKFTLRQAKRKANEPVDEFPEQD